jgi:hypothetical protein
MSGFAVFIVDHDGEAVELGPQAKHKLKCDGEQCVFPKCPCAPAMRSVTLKSPTEPRLNAGKR